MSVYLSNLPNGKKQYFDIDGNPLAGGLVYYYVPSTTTYVTTYADSGGVTANTNPVVLDASGSCTAFATGNIREYLTDALGNLISDTIVSGSPVSSVMVPVVQAATLSSAMSLLGINTAIQPVVAAASATSAMTLLGVGGASFGGAVTVTGAITASTTMTAGTAYLNGTQTISANPTANGTISTLTSLNVQGNAVSANGREFLVNLGLTSSIGLNGTATPDKVTLYSGLQAQAGTSDVWTVNSCLTQMAGSGTYNAQGFELDFNNNNIDRGDTAGTAGLAAPVSYGMSITGAGSYRSTAGLLINSSTANNATGIWNRGICFAGTFNLASIEDNATSTNFIKAYGNYGNGLDLSAANITTGGAAIFLPNAANLTWRNGNNTATISDTVTSGNSRLVGSGATVIQMMANTSPYTSNGMSLGGSNLLWNSVYATTVFTSSGTVSTSDPAMKTNMQPLPPVAALVEAIKPITYNWIDGHAMDTARMNWGFSAADVKQAFDAIEMDFGGHVVDENGKQGLRYEQLIAIVWKRLQEIGSELAALKP